MSMVILGPLSAVWCGVLFACGGIIVEAVYLSFRNRRDPEVQRLLREIQQVDDDEAPDDALDDDTPPDADADAYVRPEE